MTFRAKHRWLRRLALGLVLATFATPAAAQPDERGGVQDSIARPSISPPPKPSDHRMHWYRSQPSARTLQSRAGAFGSVAVLGLESMRDLASLRETYGFEHVQAFPGLHAAAVNVDPSRLRLLLANAPGDSRIRYVTPVGPSRRFLGLPNDPLLQTVDRWTALPFEWQFGVSGVERALELSPGSPSIVVGVIDTGVADVPDLAGKVDARWSLGQNREPVAEGFDVVGHGTAVASLIAANTNDGFGMAGFGGATHVISFRLDDLSDPAIAVAITKLVSLGVRIINMSIGGTRPDTPILVDALHKAAAEGVLLVAAAGNSQRAVSYPAADLQPAGGGPSFGLAVGASDFSGNLAGFSNRGEHLSLLAPGDHSGPCSGVLVAIPPLTEALDDPIYSCHPIWPGEDGARYAYVPGTSFSAPEVSGIAALIWAARPELKNYEVADILKQSAQRGATGWTPTMGCGRLDAAAALELATGRSTPGAPCSASGAEQPAWPSRTKPPTVVALASSGSRGTMVRLPFRVGGVSRELAASIAVQSGGTTIAHVSRGFFGARSGREYALAWRAPKARMRGALRFCVVLTDLAGAESAPSCAPIGLR